MSYLSQDGGMWSSDLAGIIAIIISRNTCKPTADTIQLSQQAQISYAAQNSAVSYKVTWGNFDTGDTLTPVAFR